jgi:hypothetical protein
MAHTVIGNTHAVMKHMHTCMETHTHALTHRLKHSHTRTHINTYYTYAHILIDRYTLCNEMHMHTYMHACIPTYIPTYIETHAHAYTCVCAYIHRNVNSFCH